MKSYQNDNDILCNVNSNLIRQTLGREWKRKISGTFRKYDTTLTQFGETQIGILCDISLYSYSLSKQYFTSTS